MASCGKITLLIITILIWLGSSYINAVARLDISSYLLNTTGLGFFESYIKILLSEGNQPITWIQKKWIVIFSFQAIFFTQAIWSEVKSTSKKLSFLSSLLPSTSIVAVLISLLFDFVFMVFWSKFSYAGALICKFQQFILLCYVLHEVCRKTEIYEPLLKNHGLRSEKWINIIFIHNGIGLHVAWIFVEICQGLNAFIINDEFKLGFEKFENIIPPIIASLNALGLLIWFTIDIFSSKIYTRWLLLPYCGIVFDYGGFYLQFFKEWDEFGYAIIISWSVCAFLLLAKLIVSIRESTRKSSSFETNQNETLPFSIDIGSTEL